MAEQKTTTQQQQEASPVQNPQAEVIDLNNPEVLWARLKPKAKIFAAITWELRRLEEEQEKAVRLKNEIIEREGLPQIDDDHAYSLFLNYMEYLDALLEAKGIKPKIRFREAMSDNGFDGQFRLPIESRWQDMASIPEEKPKPFFVDWLRRTGRDKRLGIEIKAPVEAEALPEGKDAFSTAEKEQNIFRKRGDVWDIRFNGGRVFTLNDTKGMGYISSLLVNQGRVIPVITLANDLKVIPKDDIEKEPDLIGAISGAEQEILDEKAIHEYRKKARELRQEEEDLLAMGNMDKDRQKAIADELAFIANELGKSLDKTGKSRKFADDDKRAADAVRKAYKGALEAIKGVDVALYDHLNKFMKSGYQWAYLPYPPIFWAL